VRDLVAAGKAQGASSNQRAQCRRQYCVAPDYQLLTTSEREHDRSGNSAKQCQALNKPIWMLRIGLHPDGFMDSTNGSQLS
jgi:hypothetical protein